MQSSTTNSSTMTLPTVATPQTPSSSDSHDTIRLGAGEQFVIGIISGVLSALGLSPVKWILFVVILPSMALELWEAYQLTFGNPDMAEMKQRKRLRQQQFGHGVISGSGVSHLVADLLFQPSIYTVLNTIMYLCLSICWTLFWTLPSMAEMEKALQQQPKTESFFQGTELKSAALLQKKKKKRSLSSRRKIQKTEVPMGDQVASPAITPQKRVRVASLA